MIKIILLLLFCCIFGVYSIDLSREFTSYEDYVTQTDNLPNGGEYEYIELKAYQI